MNTEITIEEFNNLGDDTAVMISEASTTFSTSRFPVLSESISAISEIDSKMTKEKA